MAGTYLQQDVYGQLPASATPLFDAAAMSDHQLVELVRATAAVKTAHKRCEWVVATSLYQPKAAVLHPPNTSTPECWLAFLDRDEHVATGWTKVPLILFDTWERNENIFKVMLPAVLPGQRLVYLNHALPQARCLSLAHLVRGRELARGAENQPHMLASKIPNWSGRAHLPGQLEMTRGYLERRNASADLTQFADLEARMARAGFNASVRSPVTDTLWMIWPAIDEVAEAMSRLWMREVARHSCFEKASYPFVISQVPKFVARLTDAIYIYSPEQRCGYWSGGSGGNASKGGAKSRKRHQAKRRLHGRRRLFGGAKMRGGSEGDGS